MKLVLSCVNGFHKLEYVQLSQCLRVPYRTDYTYLGSFLAAQLARIALGN